MSERNSYPPSMTSDMCSEGESAYRECLKCDRRSFTLDADGRLVLRDFLMWAQNRFEHLLEMFLFGSRRAKIQVDFYGHYIIEEHKRSGRAIVGTERIEYFGTPRMIKETDKKQFFSDLRAVILWQANDKFSSYVDTEKIQCKMIVNCESIFQDNNSSSSSSSRDEK